MHKLLPLFCFACLQGCAVGPDFEVPEHSKVTNFMGAAATPQSEALAGWKQIYSDPHLQKLISQALVNNQDMLIAQSKIIEARARYRITDAALWPDVSVGLTSEREEELNSGPENSFDLKGYLSWELDLFGSNRRASEAALANYYSQEQARNALQLALIADVAQQFFALKEVEEQLKISLSTIKLREKELEIARIRKKGGIISGLEQRQAEVELESAKVKIPPLQHSERRIINQLKFLIGDANADVQGGNELSVQILPKQLPTGLPSELLKRRPDVQQAMYQWQAAMAEIGVEKAALFPKLNLYAELGSESTDFNDLLASNSQVWLLGSELLMPIFNMGRNQANLTVAEQRAYQASIKYQKTVLVALQEVSNQLSNYQSAEQSYDAQRSLVLSSQDYYRLARLRYSNGVASSLDLMDAQRQLFSAEIALSQAKNDRLQSLATLYKALGGGWYELSEQELEKEKVVD
jgi:multidrug efflux system outer membrane protein